MTIWKIRAPQQSKFLITNSKFQTFQSKSQIPNTKFQFFPIFAHSKNKL